MNLKKSQIKVHEIIVDDLSNDESMKLNMDIKAAKAGETNASPRERGQTDKASNVGGLAGKNY